MNKRITVLSMALLASFGIILIVATPSAAQNAFPVNDLTIQAGVNDLITATARTRSLGTLAPTIEAAFHLTLAASISPSPASTLPTETPLGLNAATMTDTVHRQETQAAQETQRAQLPLEGALLTPLVTISGGTFQMGTTSAEIRAAVDLCVNGEGGNCQIAFGDDSLPAHSVTLPIFNIDRTEVTYFQYVAFLNTLGTNGHYYGCGEGACIQTKQENPNSKISYDGQIYSFINLLNNYPITDVTWYGADAYCRAIGRRLPTEAEWEWAARGSDGRIYPWGNNWDPLLAKTSIPEGDPGTLEVGSFPAGASPFGVLDMAGNVAEWVSDWYNPTFYQQPEASGANPQGPEGGNDTSFNNQKVIRGGSWDAKPFFARSVHRQSAFPNTTGAWLGFRCASTDAAAPFANAFSTLPVTLSPTVTPSITSTLSPTPSLTPTPTSAG